MPYAHPFLILPALLALGACGTYDPPVQGGHTAEQYKTDLGACRKYAHHQVYLKAAASPGTWIISPITSPPRVRAGIRSCLEAKGYTLEKADG